MQTIGVIHKAVFIDVTGTRGACVWIGSSDLASEMFTIYHRDGDPADEREHKTSMLGALCTALAGRLTVVVSHADTSGVLYELAIVNAGWP